MSSNKKNWIKPRHKVVQYLAKIFFLPWSVRKYNIRIERCEEARGRQILILFNHQTAHDQFFVAGAFDVPVYYIASEDIFSMGFISRLLTWAVAPIPIKKQSSDVKALKTCLKLIKEGGTIALAPEGNRTFDGRLCYIKPTIAAMAKRFKLPIACFRIEGGYGVHPRWSDEVRRGEMRAYVSRIIEPEEYAALSDDELLAEIKSELDVREDRVNGLFKGEHLAEYLERAMYVCPSCGLTAFKSQGDEFTCTKCGLGARYLPTKEIEGVGGEFPFRFMADWYDYQCSFVNKLNLAEREDELFYQEKVSIYKVHLYDRKELLYKDAEVELMGGSIRLTAKDFARDIPFGEAKSITVLGKNKVDIYCKDVIYQLKGDERFNALKYVNFYNRWINTKEGHLDEQFLGL